MRIAVCGAVEEIYGQVSDYLSVYSQETSVKCESTLYHTIDDFRDAINKGVKFDVVIWGEYNIVSVSYPLGPITYEGIKGVLDKYRSEKENTKYLVRQRSEQIYIPVNEIMYMESANTKCYIHCANQKSYTIYKQLRHVQTELNDGRFLRCHQSFLVNMNYIEKAKDVFVLQDGTEILIKQKEKRMMHQHLRDYLGQRDILIGASEYEY